MTQPPDPARLPGAITPSHPTRAEQRRARHALLRQALLVALACLLAAGTTR
ncbi:hypothetical protein [Amycolatopsis anabasis]|uniref:hypothetical protein n=1 Tax=Amycolatopsis anabasis TaxID=1840409 RepID=UPI0015D4335E|nr:hypothetical protein [Amycolatopsis anabasis]